MNCGLPPGSYEEPLDDPQQEPQQEHLPVEAEGNTKKFRIEDMVYSPDGTKLAVAAGNGIWLYDAQTGQELAQCAGHTHKVFSVAFRPDGEALASIAGGHDGTIRIWDVHTGKNLRTFKHTVWNGAAWDVVAWDVAFSPDGKTIVGGGANHKACLLDADTGKLIRTFTGHTGYDHSVQSVAFSPDGKTIAGMGGHSGTVILWEANTGKLLRTFPGTANQMSQCLLTFSPDGRMIASSHVLGTISLWDVNTGKRLQAITNIPIGRKASSVFSPDGKMIAWIKSLDIVLWDVNTGKEVRTLSGYRENNPLQRDRFGRYIFDHPPGIFLAFNPDGKTIAAASRHFVHLWDVNTGYLRKLISIGKPKRDYYNMPSKRFYNKRR